MPCAAKFEPSSTRLRERLRSRYVPPPCDVRPGSRHAGIGSSPIPGRVWNNGEKPGLAATRHSPERHLEHPVQSGGDSASILYHINFRLLSRQFQVNSGHRELPIELGFLVILIPFPSFDFPAHRVEVAEHRHNPLRLGIGHLQHSAHPTRPCPCVRAAPGPPCVGGRSAPRPPRRSVACRFRPWRPRAGWDRRAGHLRTADPPCRPRMPRWREAGSASTSSGEDAVRFL